MKSGAGLPNQWPHCRSLWMMWTGRCSDTTDDINLFTEVVLSYMQVLIGETVPTITLFPNQKLWVDRSCATSYNTVLTTRVMEDYKEGPTTYVRR